MILPGTWAIMMLMQTLGIEEHAVVQFYTALAISTDNSLLTIIADVEPSLLVDGCGVVTTASDPRVPSNIPGCPLWPWSFDRGILISMSSGSEPSRGLPRCAQSFDFRSCRIETFPFGIFRFESSCW